MQKYIVRFFCFFYTVFAFGSEGPSAQVAKSKPDLEPLSIANLSLCFHTRMLCFERLHWGKNACAHDKHSLHDYDKIEIIGERVFSFLPQFREMMDYVHDHPEDDQNPDLIMQLQDHVQSTELLFKDIQIQVNYAGITTIALFRAKQDVEKRDEFEAWSKLQTFRSQIPTPIADVVMPRSPVLMSPATGSCPSAFPSVSPETQGNKQKTTSLRRHSPLSKDLDKYDI